MALYPTALTRDVTSIAWKVRTNVDGSRVLIGTVTYTSGTPATETIELPIAKVG